MFDVAITAQIMVQRKTRDFLDSSQARAVYPSPEPWRRSVLDPAVWLPRNHRPCHDVALLIKSPGTSNELLQRELTPTRFLPQ